MIVKYFSRIIWFAVAQGKVAGPSSRTGLCASPLKVDTVPLLRAAHPGLQCSPVSTIPPMLHAYSYTTDGIYRGKLQCR